jgi:hypothetical protein
MKVLKASEAQYKELNGFKNLPHILEFTKDANDNWIVGENILKCDGFSKITDKLKELEVIDYNPIIEEEEEIQK